VVITVPARMEAASPNARSRKWLVASRIVASLVGGYAFVWGLATLGWSLLLMAGVDFANARTSVMLLAFVVYLGAFLWAFAERSVARVWLVLGGGGVAMSVIAWMLIVQLSP
jgi:hypothetical protein